MISRPDVRTAVEFTSRVAVEDDTAALRVVMDRAISELQAGFLTDSQISSSRAFMGIDAQLITDGTYYIVESGAEIAGCGGWSRRATLYGNDAMPGRDSRLLDPKVEPARVRRCIPTRPLPGGASAGCS